MTFPIGISEIGRGSIELVPGPGSRTLSEVEEGICRRDWALRSWCYTLHTLIDCFVAVRCVLSFIIWTGRPLSERGSYFVILALLSTF